MPLAKRFCTILTLKSETLRANIRNTAAALGIETERYAKLCIHLPALAVMRAEKIHTRLSQLARLLGLDVHGVLPIVQRQPALLSLKAATVAEKFKIIQRLAALNGDIQSPLAIVQQLPASLCYSAERLRRCARLLKLSPGRASVACILTYKLLG